MSQDLHHSARRSSMHPEKFDQITGFGHGTTGRRWPVTVGRHSVVRLDQWRWSAMIKRVTSGCLTCQIYQPELSSRVADECTPDGDIDQVDEELYRRNRSHGHYKHCLSFQSQPTSLKSRSKFDQTWMVYPSNSGEHPDGASVLIVDMAMGQY